MNKTFLLLVVGLALVLTLAACAPTETQPDPAADPVVSEETPEPAAEAIVLKLGHKQTPESIEGQTLQKFADLANEKSGGSLSVQVYPQEQLGDTMTQIDNLFLGTQDMYADGSEYFARYEPVFGCAAVPYLFPTADSYFEALRGDLGATEEAAWEAAGFKNLTSERNFKRGPFRVIVATKPITTAADFAGLRMRGFDSDVYMQGYAELQANPIVIAWTECYLALKNGTVEAVTSPYALVYAQKFTEVAKYVTRTDEYIQDMALVMNLEKFNSLSAEHQQILLDAANEASEWNNEYLDQYNEEMTQLMVEEHGMEYYELPLAEKQLLRTSLTSYYEDLIAKGTIPQDLYDQLNEIAAAAQ